MKLSNDGLQSGAENGNCEMPTETREVQPSPKPRHVLTADGKTLTVPESWSLLKPGDAALSRRIKKDGPSWTSVEKKGRKKFSQGIWAPTERIEALRRELEIERQDPAYEKKLEAGRAKRAQAQEVYANDFKVEVLAFLNFDSAHHLLGNQLAKAIADLAVPVGSGTVARTQRIPIEQRAEAATVAWMRHQTTAYDEMKIPREKGKRREVRRMLAKRSQQLLGKYRVPTGVDMDDCPLRKALRGDSL
ncbi:MAG: hypothetical protein ACI8UO_001010 [Verrucomicrobiales bacterium]|jgi:hypothetical protein